MTLSEEISTYCKATHAIKNIQSSSDIILIFHKKTRSTFKDFKFSCFQFYK